MSPAASSSVGIVAYLALFVGVGVVFLFVNLLVGRFVRSDDPIDEKLEIYECGEPTIGSSYVQFDLRFYVVALLFIIFDVEIAFFFPWATVFGKTTTLSVPDVQVVASATADGGAELSSTAQLLYEELGVRNPVAPTTVPDSLVGIVPEAADVASRASSIIHSGAYQLALVTIVDIVVFFAVLLVGFAYVWKRGDLDWVRAVSQQATERGQPASFAPADEPVLSA